MYSGMMKTRFWLGEYTKNGVVCQTKDYQIWSIFLSRPGGNLTKRFRSEIRATKDRPSALTRK